MARGTKQTTTKKNGNGNGQALDFEATLWPAADKLRGNLDAAEYKHVVLDCTCRAMNEVDSLPHG